MTTIGRTGLRALLAAGAVALSACGPGVWKPTLLDHHGAAPPTGEIPFLKAHLHSGELVVLTAWSSPDEGASRLEGRGTRYDAFRAAIATGAVSVPLDSVALLESNDRETVGRLAFSGLVAFSALNAFVAGACLADPKSCFGSCPTFYAETEHGERLVAEGFSSSFARVIEATDVDVLPPARGKRLSLLMRNEAPETHAVRLVRLLAVPRRGEALVLPEGGGRLRRVLELVEPRACSAGARDCTAALGAHDGVEYFSPADATDLAARETVELVFPDGEGELGIVLRARNTLLTTWLFYQTIASLGGDAGAWLAALERGDPALVERSLGLARALGGIEVSVTDAAGAWRSVGAFDEAGPIASDAHLLTLGVRRAEDGPVRVRLVMARGNWRVDQVALARLGELAEPLVMTPASVVDGDGVEDPAARSRLLDPERHLVTQRGDAWRLRFDLPADASDLHLFLETRGFWYEWMRGEWAGEDDPGMAALAFSDPHAALRRLAPAFKEREAGMERTFWSSRFRKERP